MVQVTTTNLNNYLEKALVLAVQAGNIIKEAINKQKTIETKENPADLVTLTDKKVEEFLFNQLKTEFPYHEFIGEETSATRGSKVGNLNDTPTWIIDPVDGTTNFVHGFPFYCVSIGLTINKIVYLGVIYNICMEKLFYAVKDGGSFVIRKPSNNPSGGIKLNGPAVPVPSSLSQSLVTTEYGSSKETAHLDAKLRIIQSLIKEPVAARAIRSIGSAALSMCLIAEGVVDVYYEAGVHAWDVCAGAIIVQEAGGVVLNWYKDSNYYDVLDRTVICIRASLAGTESQAKLVSELKSLLVQIDYERD